MDGTCLRTSPLERASHARREPFRQDRDSLPGANAVLRIISAARCPLSLGGSHSRVLLADFDRDVDEHGIPTEDWISRVDDPSVDAAATLN